MKNSTIVLTKEELAAENEPPIQAKDFLEELLPLLEECFIGDFLIDGDNLTYSMRNGQKIKLTASIR